MPERPALDLPPIGSEVQVALGRAMVAAHLAWSHHPTLAGQIAVLVRGQGFESVAWPGHWTLAPPPASPADVQPSDPAQLSLFS